MSTNRHHLVPSMRRMQSAFAAALLALTLIAVPAPSAHASHSDDVDYQQLVDITFPFEDHVAVRYRDDYDASRGGGRHHQSTDLMVPLGTPVHAAMGGTVRWMSGNPLTGAASYGWMVRVAGDDGRTYAYVHLGEQDGPWDEAYAEGIVPGARVDRGQLLGWAGCSGSATCGGGEHLHFEIHDHNVVDPYDYHDHERINPHRSLVDAERRGDYPYPGMFRDVGTDHTHVSTIEDLALRGITRGCDQQRRFCPEEPVTRQQMASFLVRAFDLESPEQQGVFDDVPTSNSHRHNIDALAAAGITQGCTPTSFCPSDPVTRQQMATFLVRALELETVSSHDFVDVLRTNHHAGSIAALARSGITRGCDANQFCPGDTVTRAQMASFLIRALDS